MNGEIKGYNPEEALKIIKNFVKEEYDESREGFKRRIEPKLDDSSVPYVTEEDV